MLYSVSSHDRVACGCSTSLDSGRSRYAAIFPLMIRSDVPPPSQAANRRGLLLPRSPNRGMARRPRECSRAGSVAMVPGDQQLHRNQSEIARAVLLDDFASTVRPWVAPTQPTTPRCGHWCLLPSRCPGSSTPSRPSPGSCCRSVVRGCRTACGRSYRRSRPVSAFAVARSALRSAIAGPPMVGCAAESMASPGWIQAVARRPELARCRSQCDRRRFRLTSACRNSIQPSWADNFFGAIRQYEVRISSSISFQSVSRPSDPFAPIRHERGTAPAKRGSPRRRATPRGRPSPSGFHHRPEGEDLLATREVDVGAPRDLFGGSSNAHRQRSIRSRFLASAFAVAAMTFQSRATSS